MQRKAYVPGAAALLAALVTGLTGCTSGGGDDGSAPDAKANGAPASAAPPGRYRTLPEPCGSVERSTLRDLLPGVLTLPQDQQQVLDGTPAVTYDTDRRAACSWKGQAPDSSHQLRVDFERVVSYDPAVSDDNRAQEVFEEKQSATSVPVAPGPGPEATSSPTATASTGPTATASPGQGATPDLEVQAGKTGRAGGEAEEPGALEDAPGSGQPSGDSSPDDSPSGSAEGTDGSPSPGGSATGLEPRVLEGLGDAAFIDDVLDRSGSTAQRRTVSVVFRTSNVIVTVVYAEQPAPMAELPDSKELQEKAQSVARRLADLFDE
ncbi:DUF3558 domain-containing protein [Streptomyces sp. NPDC049597]|uniref:DUF3558 domain-containing protein n=1 Tax=Streptomyces sp. NPDC049597 TaxID=3155276 RepID=UPI00341B549C